MSGTKDKIRNNSVPNALRRLASPHVTISLDPPTSCSPPPSSSLTPEEVASYLKSHPDFAKQYFLANEETLSLSRTHRTRRIFTLKRSHSKIRWSTTQPPTLDTVNSFYDEGSSSPLSETSASTYLRDLGTLPEQDLLMELVKDIASNLDLLMLCNKIMRNVSPLMKADRCSLFLVEGSDHSKRLVSKVFDLSEGSTPYTPSNFQSDPSAPEVTIDWGSGIMGHVAQTGETVSIPDAYAYPSFNKDVDGRTGYRTQSVLCMPVKIYPADKKEEVIIGVAMAINKKDQSKIIPFSQEDEKIFAKYLAFCGIGIRNAQRFEHVQEEEIFKHNLLNMAELLYDDFSSMETFARRIMEVGYTMLDCERCSVYVLAPRTAANDDIRFSEVYMSEPDVSQDNSPQERLGGMSRSKSKVSMKTLASQGYTAHKSGLVYEVALTGKKKNLNLQEAPAFNLELDNLVSRDFNVLMMPIHCKDREIVGVVQFVNRTDRRPFNDADEANFAAFAIFCGLGIKHINDYDKARTLLAQQNVTIEQLTYHIVASEEDVEKLAKQVVPNAIAMGLGDYDFYLPEADENSIIYAVSMFQYLGLIKKFSIDHRCLIKFLLTLRKNYRPVLYHNWCHAFHVANSIFVFFESGGMSTNFTDLEKLALMIASFAHDVDHRGTNNKYQQEFDTPLYNLYNTSTMEHHHYRHCALILQCEGHQILSGLTKEQYTTILNLIQQAILATDLSVYFEHRTKFFKLVEDQTFNGTNSQHKQLLMSMLMTGADLSSITKPWTVQFEVAHKVAEEFWQQGDIERAKLGHEPHPIMDRQKKADLPKMQVGFIDGICQPLYEHLAMLNPRVDALLDGCNVNRTKWVQLDHEHSRSSLSQRINEDSRHW